MEKSENGRNSGKKQKQTTFSHRNRETERGVKVKRKEKIEELVEESRDESNSSHSE